jgi:adenosylcobinamide-GDP ribazoletransferase
MCLLPPARADGLGHSAGRAPAPAAAIALILGIGIAVAATLGFGAAPRVVGIAIALALLAALLISLLALRHIGGTTGDVLGAIILTVEATALAVLASA